MSTLEKLVIAIQALRRIKDSDPGPAYYIAKAALEEIDFAEDNQTDCERPSDDWKDSYQV